MSNSVNITIQYSEDILNGYNYVTDDGSIVFSQSLQLSSFALYLFDWTIELPTAVDKRQLLYICGYWGDEHDKIKCSIPWPLTKTGKVFIDTNFERNDGFYYSEFVPVLKKKYFDPVRKIYAAGDLSRDGTWVEIASENALLINQRREICAVIQKLVF